MKEGLLWFDNDPRRNLADKVHQAATRYQAKFGYRPTICYLNQADLETEIEEVGGVRVRPATNIQRHHLWIGIENNDSVLVKAA